MARPGLRLLMMSTTGEHAQWYVLDETLVPRVAADAGRGAPHRSSASARTASRRSARVLFLGGAGGSLRAGVTENPVLLTRAIKRTLVNVTCGGAPAYVWPGGGITVMVDVARMPDRTASAPCRRPRSSRRSNSRMPHDDYRDLGGHHRRGALARRACWRTAPGMTTVRRSRAGALRAIPPIRGRSASRRCSAERR